MIVVILIATNVLLIVLQPVVKILLVVMLTVPYRLVLLMVLMFILIVTHGYQLAQSRVLLMVVKQRLVIMHLHLNLLTSIIAVQIHGCHHVNWMGPTVYVLLRLAQHLEDHYLYLLKIAMII